MGVSVSPITDRAYSTLEIKAVNVEQRIIEGIASTPTVDRVGDVMVPSGAVFKLPLPFLWKHSDPIGEVFEADVRPDGIYIKAKVSTVSKPGRVKDLVDDAWAALTSKPPLVRGLSIGWGGIESEPIKGTRATRWLKWFWGELSAVVVPMNVEATITSVKSFDAHDLAASGHVDEPVKSAGVSAIRVKAQTSKSMKTIADQISAFEATRQAKSARMTEIMTTAGDAGVTLDAEQEQEYDGLETEVKSIDAHLTRLAALEKANAAAAVPVNGTIPKTASESRGGVVTVKSNLPPGTGFTRFVMALAAGRGQRYEAIEYAKRWQSSTPEISDLLKLDTGMLTKAASDPGTTTDATWAAPLVVYNNLANEFIELLRPATILGRIPGLRRVPFNVQMPRQTAGSTVNWVGQGKPKPVGELAFDTVSLGMSKAAGIIGLTEELVRSGSPSAEGIVRGDLIAAMAQFIDVRFIDPQYAAVANVSPASITNGAAVVDSTGTTAAAFRADVKSAFATFTGANLSISGAVWIMTETQALALSMIQNALGQPEYPGITATGGNLFGLPVIVSENVPAEGGSPAGNRIILLKPSEILVADEGGVVIDVSREASVQMNTTPDDPATASTVMVSAFQNNLVFIRAERFINWLRRRTQAVVVIEGAVYVG